MEQQAHTGPVWYTAKAEAAVAAAAAEVYNTVQAWYLRVRGRAVGQGRTRAVQQSAPTQCLGVELVPGTTFAIAVLLFRNEFRKLFRRTCFETYFAE
jgi:hypothetical protein